MNTDAGNSRLALGEIPQAPEVSQTSFMQLLRNAVRTGWEKVHKLGSKPVPRLRLSETVGLGERRFVAVVEFEEHRFLVGGTSASIVLLATLNGASSEKNPSGKTEANH